MAEQQELDVDMDVEDFSPPPSPTLAASLDPESDSEDQAFGVRPYMFEPRRLLHAHNHGDGGEASGGGAAGGGAVSQCQLVELVDPTSGLYSTVEDFSPPPSPKAASLQLYYSSGSDSSSSEEVEEEEEDSESEEEHEYQAYGIRPYMFEPLALHAQNHGGGGEAAAGLPYQPRPRQSHDVSQWCSCGCCHNMDEPVARVCCRDIVKVMEKCADSPEPEASCITLHPGFYAVCLSPWLQQHEHDNMVQQYGPFDPSFTDEERYRHTAYRSFARWCWFYLGRNVRVVIPSCAVNKIKASFPSGTTGVWLPPLQME